ncbi:uncharacterized protein [Paralichthys olivaceus]|uniref:uncharacterized protein n=1 Tax=Paralichthys olivaceus TaxID=8255 RepID=UPI00375345C5
MRIQVITGILSLLVSMGLVVVIMGQYKDLATVEKESVKAEEDFQRRNDQVSNKALFKTSVETLLHQGKKELEELEPLMSKLVQEMEEKKKGKESCQTEKQTKSDELAQTEKGLTDTEASLKSESDAWKQEIVNLQEQLTGRRPICDFVKGKEAEQLCAVKPTVLPEMTTIIT